MKLSRRALGLAIVEAAIGVVLVDTLVARNAVAEPARTAARHWLRTIGATSRELRQRALSPAEWRERGEELARRVDVRELARHIDFDRLVATPRASDSPDVRVRLPADDGAADELPFVTKVFALERGRSAIIPHGHSNMVSLHLVLGGEFRLRQYDRVADEPDALVLVPTVDRIAPPGDASAIADRKGNVHWLVPGTARAFTFDVIVTGLDPALPDSQQTYVDAGRTTTLSGGRLRAAKMALAAALARYATAT